MATIASMVIQIGADTADIKRGIQDVHGDLDGLVEKVKHIAEAFGIGFSVEKVVEFGEHVIDTAHQIETMSEKLDVSIDATQRLMYAADQTGTSIETIGTSIAFMNKTLGIGSNSTKAVLDQVGLSFSDIRQMKPEDAFYAITDAIKAIQDPMLQAEAMVKLFGRSGQDLLPAVRDGIKEIGAAAATMSDDVVHGLAEAEKTLKTFLQHLTVAGADALDTIGKAFKTGNFYTPGIDFQNSMKASTQAIKDQSDALSTGIAPAVDMSEGLKALAKQEEEAARQAKAHNEKLQAAADILNGTALARQVKDLSDQVNAAGGASHITAYEMGELGKKLIDLETKGAHLPDTLQAIADKQVAASATADILKHTIADPDGMIAALEKQHAQMRDFTIPTLDSFVEHGKGVTLMLENLAPRIDLPGPPVEVWTTWHTEAAKAMDGVADDLGASFSKMIGHAGAFKSDMKGAWADIEKDAAGYFGNIASDFIHDALGAMLGALTGSKSTFASYFADLIPKFGGGGGGGGSIIPGVPAYNIGIGNGAGFIGNSGGPAGAGGGIIGNALAEFATTVGVFAALGIPTPIDAITAALGPHGQDAGAYNAQLHQDFLDQAAYLGLSPDDYAARGGVDQSGLGTNYIGSFASGGYVPARSGGTIVRVGEGGEGEYITPASQMGGGVQHLHFYIGERPIGDIVIDAVNQGAASGRVQISSRNVTMRSAYA